MSNPGEPPFRIFSSLPWEEEDPTPERAAVNPTGPYHVRKLKNDPYHRLMRDARKKKPPNALKDAQHKRTREKWERKNKTALEKRKDFVHEKRKHMGLASSNEIQGHSIMATKPLFQTNDSVTALSATPSRGIANIKREIQEIEQSLMSADLLSQQHRRLMATAATLFSIGDGKPLPKNSPVAPHTKNQKIDDKSLKILREKSATIAHLHEVLERLSALTSQLMQGSPADSKETAGYMSQLSVLKNNTEEKLNSEYDFIQGLATKSAPPNLQKVCDTVATIVRNSMSYESVTAYLYAFETNGCLSFARYLHLDALTMDDGRMIPDLYVVVSLNGETGAMFLEINHDWVQPGPVLFLKPITHEPKVLVRALSQLLAISHFSSTLGDIPVELLLSQSDIRKKYTASDSVNQVSVDEDTGALTFYLKPEIQDVSQVKEIALQLHSDVQRMTKRAGGTLRHTVQTDPDPKRAKSRRNYRVIFTATVGNGRMAATPDDLAFLSSKYGLAPAQVETIVRTINKAAK